MTTFTMLFKGLIVHHGEQVHAKTAVLVDAEHHTPKLVVPKGVPVKEPANTNWKGVEKDYGREYGLKNRKITIEGIEVSNMKIDSSFLRHVPSLKSFFEADDHIEPKVGRKELENQVTAAFVDYSGGTLSVFEVFKKEVRFIPPLGSDPKCLAETIQFVGMATGSEVKIQDDSKDYIVVPDQTRIWILNISEHIGGRHQREYRRLMQQKRDPRRMVETNRTCSSFALNGNKERFFSLSIECSNSQWP